MKVAELREKLTEYDDDATVAVRMDVPVPGDRDVFTDLAERVYRTRRGLVVIEGGE